MSGSPDVVVIGAGPYGLAASAHLRHAGADVRVFGAPMSFWKGHMPRGMCLKSSWSASRIADPEGTATLEAFERDRGARIERPIPLDDFLAYADWFRQRVAPEIDPRQVERVEASEPGFRVVLEDGEPIETQRVVVAAGIAEFAWRPPEFAGLPRELATHSSEHPDLSRFAELGAEAPTTELDTEFAAVVDLQLQLLRADLVRQRQLDALGRDIVVGGGQSALESAVLLREAGADVEVVLRARDVRWVGRATREGVVGRILFDPSDVGPALISHLVAHPRVLQRLPWSVRAEVARRSLAPGASLWLRPRAGGLSITSGRHVVTAVRTNGHLTLALDDGGTREVDHVVLATGYRVDVRRYRFLAPDLLASLRCSDGYPLLHDGLESSVRRLHFLGAPAVRSFGPLVRFVSGTGFASKALVRSLRGVRSRSSAKARGPAFDAAAPERGA